MSHHREPRLSKKWEAGPGIPGVARFFQDRVWSFRLGQMHIFQPKGPPVRDLDLQRGIRAVLGLLIGLLGWRSGVCI